MPARFAIIDRANGFDGVDGAMLQAGLTESLRRMWVAWQPHLTPAFQDYAPSVILWDPSEPLPAWDVMDSLKRYIIPTYIHDEQTSTDALGYHYHTGLRPESATFVDHGTGLANGRMSVHETLAHECHEVLGNPHLTEWHEIPWRPGWYVPRESDDALQEHYDIDLGERGRFRASNFCYPAYFGLQNGASVPGDQLDFLGALSTPFEIGPEGYQLQTNFVQVEYKFGAKRDGFSAAQVQNFIRPLSRSRRLVDMAHARIAEKAAREAGEWDIA